MSGTAFKRQSPIGLSAVTLDTHAIIALGANLGDAATTLHRALDALQALSTAPVLTSSLWLSAPVDCPPGSPPFINAVAAIVPHRTETPESCLERLQALERAAGRKPKRVVNEARPLDLDLIAFRHELRQSPALRLPHPRAHVRAFVLLPLAEIAADLQLPNQMETVANLIRRLPAAEIRLVKRV